MSLPAASSAFSDRIEEVLKKRERMASMFAMFTRLNLGERLPWIEARWKQGAVVVSRAAIAGGS
jgi:hypothetical protein